MSEGFIGLPEVEGVWLSQAANLPAPPMQVLSASTFSATILFRGRGTSSIQASDLLSRVSKKINIVNGSDIVELSSGYDNVGIILGGNVSTPDLSLSATVIDINSKRIRLNQPLNLSTQNNLTVGFASQLVTNDSRLSINTVNFNCSDSITIRRNGQLILSLFGNDEWNFNELGLTDESISPIQVSLNGSNNSTMLVNLHKYGNWGNYNASYGNI